MPLGDPIDVQIITAVLARLNAIASGDTYTNTINAELALEDGTSPRDMLAVLQVGEPTSIPGALQFETWEMPLPITLYALELGNEGSAGSRLRTGAADIHRAFMSDVHFGDLVINVEWRDRDAFYEQAQAPNVVIVPTIVYRYRRGNPYSQA